MNDTDLAAQMRLSPERMRALGYWVIDLLVNNSEGLPGRPVTRHAPPAALAGRLVERMIADGYAFPSSTVLQGRTVLRLCTINPRTTEADVRETLARLDRLAREEAAAGP